MQRGSLRITKNRDGVKVWLAQWRENGKGRTRTLGRFCDVTRADAKAEIDRIVTAVNGRSLPLRPIDTLRQFVESEYLVQRSRIWKASTIRTTEQLIQTNLLADLGSRQIATLTRRDLQAHLDGLAAKGLSKSTVHKVRFQMQAIFALAVGDRIADHDPTEGLVNPRIDRETDRRVITLDDVHRAQMSLEIRERLIFQLAVYQGMRPGEIVGLQVGDVDGDMISIRRRIYEGKVDTPKSKRGVRPVPINSKTLPVLRTYMELVDKTDPTGWLFPSETGKTPLSYANVWQDRIRPALSKIGLGHVNFQILRRTWVTEYAEVEPDPHVRAALAGHSVDVSENEYRQDKPDRLRKSMDKWGDHLQ